MSAQPHLLIPRTFEGRPLPHPDEPVFDQGLAFDVETLLNRRQVLRAMGYGAVGAGLFSLVGCAPAIPSATPGATSGTSAATSGTGVAECATIPEETAGPFPGDGTNGPDVLNQSGVVRADIRSSFGSSTTLASGVPLTIRLAILDIAQSCAPIDGAAVYLWHCDQAGRYSLYSSSAQSENYLRGVQAAGADGIVTFTSIFPACYSGRWPHIHFEVYPSLEKATNAGNKIATSQVALPEDICNQVYATSGYEQSVQNLAGVSLARDNVFGDDGGVHELGAISGAIAGGLAVDLSVPVQA
ncbi:MAG: intradiol ring-cleavage dioxygenase [Chloroflexi bacterium]|nr:MAG: intradiol ring-cleavage dioxygenase [Chloroflexota bacterium]